MPQNLEAGSRFGDGITACHLAEAGWKVCLLERGIKELDLGKDPIGNSLVFLIIGQDASEGFITVHALGRNPIANHPANEVTDADRLVADGVPATGLSETPRLDGDGGG